MYNLNKFKVMQSTLLCRKSVKAKKSEPVMSKYYFSFYNSKITYIFKVDSGCKEISSPIVLKSYITLADFKSSEFSFKKNTVVQVVQKESKGLTYNISNVLIKNYPLSCVVIVLND